MPHIRTNWMNYSPPAINAANLINMEDGIWYGLAHSGGVRNTAEFLDRNPASTTGGLDEAIADLGGSPGVVFAAPHNHPISVNYTVPTNVHLMAGRGATFTIANGVTLTINGTIEAGPYQIFSGAGTVIWGSAAKTLVFSDWLGVIFGNVGIGTASPTSLLHIYKASPSSFEIAQRLQNYAGGAGTGVGLGFSVGTIPNVKGGIAYQLDTSIGWGRGDIQFLQNLAADASDITLADAVMTIKNNGNVGLGVTDPDAKLEVAGTLHFGGAIYTWPGTSGNDGEFLKTNGASPATLLWAVPAGGNGGVTDHGALTGLADDDHPQYAALAQDENVTGDWTHSGELWTKIGIRNVKAYGAKGDGITNDDAAVQAAIAALQDGETLYFPAGIYILTTTLTINNKSFCLGGDGPELSILKFTGCHGIVADTNDIDKIIIIRDISVKTGTAGTFVALTLESENVASTTNQTLLIENVCIAPWTLADHYWQGGVGLTECWNAKIHKVNIRGKYNNMSMSYGIQLNQQCISTHIVDAHMAFMDVAVKINNPSEGTQIDILIAVYVNHGIYSTGGVPGIDISGGHVAAFKGGIYFSYVSQSSVRGVLIYKRGESTQDFIGIYCIGTAPNQGVGTSLSDNHIRGQGAGGSEHGIVVEYCNYVTATGNRVFDQDAAIWFQSHTTGCVAIGNTGTNNTLDVVDQGVGNDVAHNPFV